MNGKPKQKGIFGRWFEGWQAPEQAPPRQGEMPEMPVEDAPAADEAPAEPAQEVEEERPTDDFSEPVSQAEPLAPESLRSEPLEVPEALTVEAPAQAAPKLSWYQKLTSGLTRSSNALTENLTGLLVKRRLDDQTLEALEDVLIQADLGVDTALRIVEALEKSRYNREITTQEVRAVLAEEVSRALTPVAKPLLIQGDLKPHVVLVVGVNGSGKTTTIGKLAAKFAAEGRRVVLAAGDTFRAAAIEQLRIWGERTGAEVVAREQGSDASGLAFDALQRAREARADVLIVDTAGRLQNKANLMAELQKIVRVLKKQDKTAPHDVLLVLDATTGQNAMQQVEAFRQVCGVTGLAMTKLDGTARGGILVAIAAKHRLPVHFIGVGEGVDDLQPFEASEFARAIAGTTARIEVE